MAAGQENDPGGGEDKDGKTAANKEESLGREKDGDRRKIQVGSKMGAEAIDE